jgi:LPXTG-motif cell wall-anchored protein
MSFRRFTDEEQDRALETAGTRRARAVVIAAATAVTTAVISAGLLWGASAGATPASLAQVPAPTPTLIQGNPTTCEDAGIDGEILLSGVDSDGDSGDAGTGTVSADDKTLTVTINAGFTATGIVVKGGPDANLFSGPFVGPITIEGMQSPLNPGGNIPDISHWFVCGMTSATTTPPTTTTTVTVTGTTTTAPSLPVTGGSTAGLIAAGAVLVAGGTALLVLRRRRAASDE